MTSSAFFHMAFIIFFWCDAKFFFECTEKVIVSSKSNHFINFCDRQALQYIFFTHLQTVFGNVAVDCLPGLLFKFSANMIAAYKKYLFQFFQGDFFGDMTVNIRK